MRTLKLVIFAVLLCVSVQSAGSGTEIVLSPNAFKFSFVAYGDIRFTDAENKMVSNPAARRALVARIAEVQPAFAVIIGDLVMTGASAADWQVFDSETRPLREAGIPLFPVIGNHELYGGDGALNNYFQRFPDLRQRRWYSVRNGNCLFLMLDSELSEPGGPQWNWLRAQLDKLPSAIDFVFVVLHHPPYTRSIETPKGGHAARPAEQKLARLLQRRQSSLRARIVVLSGHVHNYERYERGGVMYVVSGGGGATPYEVVRQPGDFYQQAGPTYHFCHFTVDRTVLRMQMLKLNTAALQEEEDAKWSVADSFAIPVARPARLPRQRRLVPTH